MNHTQPTGREILVKTVVTHTVTYFLMGVLAFVVFDYRHLFEDTNLKLLMRPTSDPLVMAGPLLQPMRGLLFGIVFYVLREPLFGKKDGWLAMWAVLVIVGILGTFGPTPGSLEGMIYTLLPLSLQLTLLPEVLLQSLLLSLVLFHWANCPQKKWLSWSMGCAFVVVLVLPSLGLLAGGRR